MISNTISEELKKEYTDFANTIFLFLIKYILWLSLLLVVPAMVEIFIGFKQLELKFLMTSTILLLIVALFTLISSSYLFGPYIIQIIKQRSFTKSTLISTFKEQNDPIRKGYKTRKALLWTLYLCTAASIITYVTFSIAIMFV